MYVSRNLSNVNLKILKNCNMKNGDFAFPAPLLHIIQYQTPEILKLSQHIQSIYQYLGPLKLETLSLKCRLLAFLTRQKSPHSALAKCGHITWRRPTLTGPGAPLPSALDRFTSGFGMGPGGSNLLWSPDRRRRCHGSGVIGQGASMMKPFAMEP